MEQWLFEFLQNYLYVGIVLVLLICGIGIPIPEELTFLVAGYACDKVGGNVWLLCVCGMLGIMLGDSIPFTVGQRYGMSVLKWRIFQRILTPSVLAWARGFFEKHGSKAVFIARFVAGARMPAFFMAGTMGIKYRTFFFYDFLGAAISCPTSIYLAYRFGKEAEKWIAQSHVYLFGALGLMVAYIIFHIWWHKRQEKQAEKQGEQMLEAQHAAVATETTHAPGSDLKFEVPVKPAIEGEQKA